MTKGTLLRLLDIVAHYVILPLSVLIVIIGVSALAFKIHYLPLVGSAAPFVLAWPLILPFVLVALCLPRAPKEVRDNW